MIWFSKIAEGHGLVALQTAVENTQEVFMYASIHENEDGFGGKESVDKINLQSAYNDLSYEISKYTKRCIKNNWPSTEDWQYDYGAKIQTMQELAVHWCDSDSWGTTFFLGTKEQYEEKKKEDDRLELEEYAKSFALSKKVKLSSMEFIKAINEEIENYSYEQEEYNSGERQMEEWADYRYAGCTDSYFDDRNYTNAKYSSDISKLYDILSWLQNECPLLWAKYEESKLNA